MYIFIIRHMTTTLASASALSNIYQPDTDKKLYKRKINLHRVQLHQSKFLLSFPRG